MLLAAQLNPVVTLGAIPNSELQLSWQRAIQILGCFHSDSLSAKRCVAALTTLYEKLPFSDDTHLMQGQPRGDDGRAPAPTAGMDTMHDDPTRSHRDVYENYTDPAALVSQDVSQVFGWLDSFDDFDTTDLSWLNVVPGDFLA